MSDRYKVFNDGKGPVTFVIYKPYTIEEGTPKHKRRKLMRENVQHVSIPKQSSVDLVALTGLSVKDLKSQPELNKLLDAPIPRLRLMMGSAPPVKVEVEAPAEEPVEEAIAPPVEEPVTEPPAEEPAPKKEKKSKKKKKK
jgi:hypothetical protein